MKRKSSKHEPLEQMELVEEDNSTANIEDEMDEMNENYKRIKRVNYIL